MIIKNNIRTLKYGMVWKKLAWIDKKKDDCQA